jgi:hypothetical protein
MWPSLETASHIADVANVFFIASLVIGVVSTILIVWMANVKETHWDTDRRASRERIAQLDNETARLRAQDALTLDSLLASVQAGRSNALASEANRSTTEALAVAQGLAKRESTSEATRALYIVSKVTPFAGKKFDAVVTSIALNLGTLLGSIKAALNNAGWIEIERSDPAAGVGLLLMDRTGGPALVRIEVDASKDSELLDAAGALASALNAEGIAATVNPKTETDITNVIHILVGPKP